MATGLLKPLSTVTVATGLLKPLSTVTDAEFLPAVSHRQQVQELQEQVISARYFPQAIREAEDPVKYRVDAETQ
jgi:hypothetical protein